MSIAILSYPGDFHAAVVEWALNAKWQADATTIFTSDFPNAATYTAHFSATSVDVSHTDIKRERGSIAPDVVWRRRLAKGSHAKDLHPSDQMFIERENRRFFDGYLSVFGAEALWVNDQFRALRANHKPLQLREAAHEGWAIPETLISNDPKEIRDFVAKNDSIFKPFMPSIWKTKEGSTHTTMTSTVSIDQLINDKQLKSCAGIYQRLVRKDYELRVTVIGRSCFPVKIYSQEKIGTRTDWRVGFYSSLRIEPVALPDYVQDACLRLMDKLGLVLGAIDLAVTPQGEYVFFEVNEMGQFLWIEDLCGETPMLDAFCEFLVHADPAFKYDYRKGKNTLAEARQDASFKTFFEARQMGHEEYLPGFFYSESPDAYA